MWSGTLGDVVRLHETEVEAAIDEIQRHAHRIRSFALVAVTDDDENILDCRAYRELDAYPYLIMGALLSMANRIDREEIE